MRKLSGRSHRRIRPASKKILSSEELAQHFGIAVERLESHLIGLNIPFHKDSTGELWASVLASTLATEIYGSTLDEWRITNNE